MKKKTRKRDNFFQTILICAIASFMMLETPYLQAITWGYPAQQLNQGIGTDLDSYLVQERKTGSSMALICYTKEGVGLLNQNLQAQNSTSSWSEPLEIAPEASSLRVSRAGNSHQVLFTWITPSKVLKARIYDMLTSSFGEILTLLNGVNNYDVAGSYSDWVTIAENESREIHAVSGKEGKVTSTTLIASEGKNPKVDINSRGQAIGVFSKRESDGDLEGTNNSSIIFAYRFDHESLTWHAFWRARTQATDPTPQIALIERGSSVIAFQDRLSQAEIRDALGIKTYTFENYMTTDPSVDVASRTDESVDTFKLVKGPNSIALSYKALTKDLPRYQLNMSIPNKNGTLGRFSEPHLMSQGEGAIGAYTVALSDGQQAILGYGDDENVLLNTSGYRPGKGYRSGRNSQSINFNPDSASTVGTISIRAARTTALSSWIHNNTLYTQLGTLPIGN